MMAISDKKKKAVSGGFFDFSISQIQYRSWLVFQLVILMWGFVSGRFGSAKRVILHDPPM